ncbi:tetratricopeptide repeat protein [Actinosynnema sp. NPDC023658]|uniref:tetratricopeptide repeat protein n=1 Tax=Actinosynnema sp. NPDC023658 TaxID=3155465 RepID=UPI0033D4F11E
MRLGVLGTTLIEDDNGHVVDITKSQPRAVLALLLLSAGLPVSIDRITKVLWRDAADAPVGAENVVQGCVSQLRGALKNLHDVWIERRGPGYILHVDRSLVDVHHFRDLVVRARGEHGLERRSSLLTEALGLWRGPKALADVSYSELEPDAAALGEEYANALEDRVQADLDLGREEQLVAELVAHTGRHPGRERLRTQLITALHRCGRTSEASQTYLNYRRWLVEEHATEPGEELRRLHNDMLALPRRDESTSATSPAVTVYTSCLTIAGALPRVADLDNPLLLGVHPAPPVADDLLGADTHDVPPYVTRDIDPTLRAALRPSRFVLVVGAATAGKTRAAYQAMRTELPGHLLLAPDDKAGLTVAIDHADNLRDCVLWLDDLEHYLGRGGLTRAAIARFLTSEHHRVILSTLRSVEDTRYATPHNKELLHYAVQALKTARRVSVDRLFSPAEQRRARALAVHDSRLARSLATADRYGVTESIAAGPALYDIWRAAQAEGSEQHGAAIVTAAVNCRRAGLTRPLSRRLLIDLAEQAQREFGGLRPQPVPDQDQAWAWAAEPRLGTAALITPDGHDGGVTVFEYLVDAVTAQTPSPAIPAAGLERMLREADTEEASRIGGTAIEQGEFDIAVAAFNHAYQHQRGELGAEHPETLANRDRLAFALRTAGQPERAAHEHRAVLHARVSSLGAEHPDTLVSRNNLGVALYQAGRWSEAETELATVLRVRRRVLSDDDPEIGRSISNHASVLMDLGRWFEAERLAREAVVFRTRVHGPDDRNTFNSRNNLGLVLQALGRYEEAEAEHTTTLEARERLLRPDHPDILESMHNRATALRHLNRAEEAEQEHRQVLHRRAQTLGEHHYETIDTRIHLAADLLALRRTAEAEEVSGEAITVANAVYGPEHPYTLDAHDVHAQALAVSGKHAEAVDELTTVIDLRRRLQGDEHPYTLASRLQWAIARSQQGDQDVELLLTELHASASALLRPHHPLVRSIMQAFSSQTTPGATKDSSTGD